MRRNISSIVVTFNKEVIGVVDSVHCSKVLCQNPHIALKAYILGQIR